MSLTCHTLVTHLSPMSHTCHSMLECYRKVHAHIQPTLSDDSQVMKPAPRVFSLENRSEWDNSDSDEEDDDVIHHDLARHYHVLGTKGRSHTISSV